MSCPARCRGAGKARSRRAPPARGRPPAAHGALQAGAAAPTRGGRGCPARRDTRGATRAVPRPPPPTRHAALFSTRSRQRWQRGAAPGYPRRPPRDVPPPRRDPRSSSIQRGVGSSSPPPAPRPLPRPWLPLRAGTPGTRRRAPSPGRGGTEKRVLPPPGTWAARGVEGCRASPGARPHTRGPPTTGRVGWVPLSRTPPVPPPPSPGPPPPGRRGARTCPAGSAAPRRPRGPWGPC